MSPAVPHPVAALGYDWDYTGKNGNEQVLRPILDDFLHENAPLVVYSSFMSTILFGNQCFCLHVQDIHDLYIFRASRFLHNMERFPWGIKGRSHGVPRTDFPFFDRGFLGFE
jgi:hypothetical protein